MNNYFFKGCLALVTAVICCGNVFAQNVKPFAITYRSDVSGKFPKSIVETYSFKPLKQSTDNSITYECRLLDAAIAEESVEIFNTNAIKSCEFRSTEGIEKLAMLNKAFTITLNGRNLITKVEGLDALFNDVKAKWQLKPIVFERLNTIKDEIKADLQRLFLKLPPKPIAYGSKWNDASTRYNVFAIKGAILEMNVKADSVSNTFKRTENGKITYNDVTRVTEAATAFIECSDPPADYYYRNDFSQQLVKDAKAPVIDSAWVNMAIRASFWSEALMTNERYDSTKVFSFFNENEKRFGKDKYFQLARLDIVQQLDLKNGYLAYDSLLIQTPNRHVAKSRTHMFNKMQEVFRTSVDSTLDLMGYYSKTGAFENWFHYNYAVNFLFGTVDYAKWEADLKSNGLTDYQIKKIIDGDKRQVINRSIVLDSLVKSKNDSYRQIATPLSIWLDADKHKSDAAYLKNVALKYRRMDDNVMKKGFAPRYAIRLYGALLAVVEKNAAETLLDHIQHKLISYEADSADDSRNTYRMLLAHTYYLKANAERKKDSVKSFKYLSSAAYYSPKTDAEKSGLKSADRYFLDMKESYEQDFIEVLFNGGKEDVALANIAKHIDRYPETIDQMRILVGKHFKDKDFSQFIIDNVVSGWEAAPEFTIVDVNGKEQSLAAYKGKWLLLDFWGTWCGPCQVEMPEVNAFNKDLVAGKYSGVKFLSIACNDTPEKVRAYFKRTGYNFPVIVGNYEISKSYKINAVPRKILISPDGKMKMLTHGADWVDIVKKFSQLYAAN